MGYNTTPLVVRSGVRPNWLPDERFWYLKGQLHRAIIAR